jgi:hypothetical protein
MTLGELLGLVKPAPGIPSANTANTNQSPVTGGAIPGAADFVAFLNAIPGQQLNGAQLATLSGADNLLSWVPGVEGAQENAAPAAPAPASGARDSLVIFALAAAALWWWWSR